MEIITRRAVAEDLAGAATVLGAAFTKSPWTRWTVDARDHADRIVALQRLALEHFAVPFGDVSVTTADGAITSVAAWTESSRSSSLTGDPALSAEIARLEGDRHHWSRSADLQLAPLRPTERHLALGVIGTQPSAQRLGHATRTLAPLLAIADADRLPIWLETSEGANVAFYERLDFAVEQHVRIEENGPDVWIMRRPHGISDAGIGSSNVRHG